MNKKTVRDIDVKGKKCLVRVDFNVPIRDGVIMDTTRIEGAISTINYLVDEGAKVILCSHMGRPKGKVNLEFSLRLVAIELEKLIKKPVEFATDAIGEDAKSKVKALQNGSILLLENLRFYPGEEANDKDFAKGLAELCDVYVNDAFGTAHRAHASTAGIVQYGFVKTAVSGFLIEKELKIIGGALSDAQRPFVAILGGAKVSDKIGVINSFIDKVDSIIIGGAMAYTFAKAKGQSVGDSKFEADKLDLALELLDKAKAKGVQVLLPVDTTCADEFSPDANTRICEGDIDEGWMGLDIGPRSIELFKGAVLSAKTIIWNGPMGVFEMEKFSAGTTAIAEAMANSNAVPIIGGGDSASAVTRLGFADKMTHISTGGGASLEFMEGLILPGIDCLNDK